MHNVVTKGFWWIYMAWASRVTKNIHGTQIYHLVILLGLDGTLDVVTME